MQFFIINKFSIRAYSRSFSNKLGPGTRLPVTDWTNALQLEQMPLTWSLNDCKIRLEQMLSYEDIKLRSKTRWWGHVYIHTPSLKRTLDQVTRPSAVILPTKLTTLFWKLSTPNQIKLIICPYMLFDISALAFLFDAFQSFNFGSFALI